MGTEKNQRGYILLALLQSIPLLRRILAKQIVALALLEIKRLEELQKTGGASPCDMASAYIRLARAHNNAHADHLTLEALGAACKQIPAIRNDTNVHAQLQLINILIHIGELYEEIEKVYEAKTFYIVAASIAHSKGAHRLQRRAEQLSKKPLRRTKR